jgi:outer membrane protein
MNYRLKLALSCILAVSATTPSYGANLLDVFQRAQQADPSVREADATRLASREAKPQAWAALLPQIDGSASYRDSSSDGTSETVGPLTDPATGLPFVPPQFGPISVQTESDGTTKSYAVSLRQSIFRWNQWVELKRADAQVAQAEANYRAAEQDLVVRVAQRYFNVLAAKDTLDANNAAAEAAARQLEQAEKRFDVGLIAITDVQDTRAERDRTAADVISAKRALATSIELLREITGDEISELNAPGDDMPLIPPSPASEDRWVTAALEDNLSLISARLNEEIASKNVAIARTGHFPTLDLSASRGNTQGDTTTVRGTQAPTNPVTDSDSTTFTLSLNVPIFSGGATQSRVRQSVYTQRATRERVERVTRETERAARDNYLGVISNIARVQALKQAYESSKTALQATQAGYEVGTRTSVDVLISQRAVYSAQTTYLRSRYDYINSLIALKQAAGMLTQKDIEEINGWLTEPSGELGRR